MFLPYFAKSIPYYLEPGHWDDFTLQSVEAKLAETPCCGRSGAQTVFPDEKAPELLRARWDAH